MAPKERPLDIAYTQYMANQPFGTALYTPPPYRLFHPGSVGYFDREGSWNPIADLSALPDELVATGYSRVAERLERAPLENRIEWGPKISSKTRARKLGLEADVSGLLAALPVPVEIGAWYCFRSEDGGGAVLLTKGPLQHERYYYESPFKDWVRENATELLARRKEIVEHDLWIVTSTWSTEECALNAWNQASKGVNVGFKTGVVGFGEVAPSGDWYEDTRDEGWIRVKSEKVSCQGLDPDRDFPSKPIRQVALYTVERSNPCPSRVTTEGSSSSVVFGFDIDVFLSERCRIPSPVQVHAGAQTDQAKRLKLRPDSSSLRHAIGSEQQVETLVEIPVPAEMLSTNDEAFAVDCEQVLESTQVDEEWDDEGDA